MNETVRLITAVQCCEARGLLYWSRDRLAAQAGLTVSIVKKIEKGLITPRHADLHAVRSAFEEAGIIFVEEKGGILQLVAPQKLHSKNITIISSAQCREARTLLGWSRARFAKWAGLSIPTIARIENGSLVSRYSTLVAIRAAFERAGVEFIRSESSKDIVRLKAPDPAMD